MRRPAKPDRRAPRTDWRPLLDQAAGGVATGPALARPLPSSTRAALAEWLDRLVEWNARIDLTAARSPEEIVDLMVADALFLAPRLPSAGRVVDVGTGAGAPGLPLALLREDLRLTLVEPLGKRVSFLRTVMGAAQRSDVVIEAVRGEALVARRPWQVAVSRATLAPDAWLSLGLRLVEPGGLVVVLLARESPPTHPGAQVVSDESYAWPLTGKARRAVVYRAAASAATPAP